MINSNVNNVTFQVLQDKIIRRILKVKIKIKINPIIWFANQALPSKLVENVLNHGDLIELLTSWSDQLFFELDTPI